VNYSADVRVRSRDRLTDCCARRSQPPGAPPPGRASRAYAAGITSCPPASTYFSVWHEFTAIFGLRSRGYKPVLCIAIIFMASDLRTGKIEKSSFGALTAPHSINSPLVVVTVELGIELILCRLNVSGLTVIWSKGRVTQLPTWCLNIWPKKADASSN